MTGNDGLIMAWDGGALTALPKLDVHRRGLRHPAVSVFVMDGGRTLIQQRALAKYHTPGLWANSCCTHPHPGETAVDCARRRTTEELGLTGLTFVHLGEVEYRAVLDRGLTEHEVVQIFVATAPLPILPDPDPAEVMALRWTTPGELTAAIADAPASFTPWLRIYMRDHSARIFGPQAQPA